MGVRVRRRYGFDHDSVLTAYEDEPVDQESTTGLLAAEIERPRKGPMRDIVATIQPEQMRFVRARLDRTLCIQGAPGTGKTAVGLHRLAYLLYTERERLRKAGGVAVIGPNRSFLPYIRNVLPALGEAEAAQATIDEFIGFAVDHADEPSAARVQGDARMAEVVQRQLWSRLQHPQETVEVKHQHRTWRLSPEELAEGVDAVRDRGTDYGAGRELLAQRLAHLVLRQMERTGNATATLPQLRRHKAINRAVGQLWPTVDPARLVFDLLDEAAALIERPRKRGHVVVDEAQDLSPMQFRTIARRMAGSGTVLGDLAQATSPAAIRDWAAVLTHLGRPDGHIEELTRGYRVPAQVIDFAARLLPHIAPDLRGPASLRQSADAIHITRTTPQEKIATTCAAALAGEGSVGIIAADHDIAELRRAFSGSGIQHAVLGTGDLETARLTLAPVTLSKGLEFDTVVVVEPARIAQAEQRGLQRLYVALTRAVSNLHIIHAAHLPEPLVWEPATTR